MLPRVLCDDLCSLNPNEDKLTFSVIFTVKSDGTLSTTTPPWIGRTVIRSSCRFHYDEVQDILNEFDRSWAALKNGSKNERFACGELEDILNEFDGAARVRQHFGSIMDSIAHPDVNGGHEWGDVWKDLVVLESVTQQIRRHRFQNGSLLLHQSRLIANEEFLFGDDTKFSASPPVIGDDEEADDSSETSHHLIEELMLLANRIVAERMVNSPISGPFKIDRYDIASSFRFRCPSISSSSC